MFRARVAVLEEEPLGNFAFEHMCVEKVNVPSSLLKVRTVQLRQSIKALILISTVGRRARGSRPKLRRSGYEDMDLRSGDERFGAWPKFDHRFKVTPPIFEHRAIVVAFPTFWGIARAALIAPLILQQRSACQRATNKPVPAERCFKR